MPAPDELSPDGRWKIRWRITKERHSPLESDLCFAAELFHVATGRVLESWIREEYGSSDGWQYQGIKSLRFAPDSSAVTVVFEDGWVQSIPLPLPGEYEKRFSKSAQSAVQPAVKPAIFPGKWPLDRQ